MVTLIVNVACLWGKTKITYEQLSILQERYKDKGFVVLAFPSNDYHQEYTTDVEIQNFVKENFPQVTFPIFSVGSLVTNPIYQQLQKQLPGPTGNVKHNFFKYLVNKDGIAIKLYTKKQDPLSFVDDIEALLLQEEESDNGGVAGGGGGDNSAPRHVKMVTH